MNNANDCNAPIRSWYLGQERIPHMSAFARIAAVPRPHDMEDEQ